MENAVKALEIAAGVLLAIMIMSLIAWFFSAISTWPQEQDDIESAEQLAKFNAEYEVYQKSAMYGVDVISCLNKAQSNNEKYADGGFFLNQSKYGQDFYIQVKVKINSDLEESLIAERYNENNKLEPLAGNTRIQNVPTMEKAGFNFNSTYTKFTANTLLNVSENINKLSGSNYLKSDGDYNLLCIIIRNAKGLVTNVNYNTPLNELIEHSSSDLKQTVTNKENGDSLKVWARAEWKTALYDFKTRKFKCEDIKYHNVTGRVCEITFTEI